MLGKACRNSELGLAVVTGDSVGLPPNVAGGFHMLARQGGDYMLASRREEHGRIQDCLWGMPRARSRSRASGANLIETA